LCDGCSQDPAAREARFLARGKQYLKQKDYDRAVLEFRNATQPKPKDAEPWYQLGVAYLLSQQTGPSVLAFRKALELDPHHAGAQLKLAELMAQSRQPAVLEDAVKRLNDVLSAGPDNAEALDALAIAELRLNKPEDAVKHLQEALNKFPGHLKSAAALAVVQFSRHDFAGAEETLKSATAQAPRSADAANALAYLYFLEKKFPLAEAELNRALQIDPANNAALLELGGLQVSAGRIGEADRTYARLASTPKTDFPYAHAAFLLHEGRNDEAIGEFEKLANASPQDHQTRLRLAAAYIKAGRTQQGLKYATDLLKRNPKDTDALLLRSRLYLDSGQPVQGEQDLQEVLHFMPDSADAHYGLSRVYSIMGLAKSRQQELGQVIKLSPGVLGPRVELAKAQLAEGHAEAALATMDAAPENQKATITAIAARNWPLLALKRKEEAGVSIDRGLSLGRTSDLLLQRGFLKSLNNDYGGALADAEEALKLDPSSFGAVNLAVQMCVARKQDSLAVAILHDVAARNPKSARMQTVVGWWLHHLGKPEEARTFFNAAKALNPRYTRADLAQASVDIGEGKLDSARAALTRVISAEPRNELAHMMLAGIEYKAKNRDAALVQFRAVVNLNPDNVQAVNAMAYLLAQDSPDEARKYAEHALELAPGDAAIQDTLGWICYQKGQYDRAVGYLTMSVAKDPSPVHQFHLGMSYLKTGDREHGLENMQKALAKDPSLAKTNQSW